MAKKSKNKKFGAMLTLVSFLSAIVSIVMLVLLPFVSAIGKITGKTTTYSGIAMIFGGNAKGVVSSNGNSVTSEVSVAFNFFAFLALLLLAIGIIGLILSFIVKKDLSTPVKVLSGLLLIGAGVILFTGLNSSLAAIVKPSLGDNATQENIEQSVQLMLALDNYSLGLGAIIGGICSCVSGAFAVLAGFFK